MRFVLLSSDQPPAKKTPKIESFLSTKRCSVDRAHKLNDLIAKMIVEDLRPINTVEGHGFRKLMEFSEPNYVIPGLTFFTSRLEQMFVDVKNSLQEELALASFVSLTADIWTSSRNESYMSVTSHFIDSEWTLNRVLTSLPVDDRHTGENIAAWLLKTMEKYNVCPSKVVALVHDNGSNIVAAAERNEAQHNWVSVRCAAHSLQLIVNAALKSDPAIMDSLAAARHVVEYFKRSALATSLLHQKQREMSVPQHELVIEVSTRWNSTLRMIERLIEQRWSVSSVLVDRIINKKTVKTLTEAQWEILSRLKDCLQPFDAATTFVSSDSYVTSAAVPSLIHGLCSKMIAAEDDYACVKMFKEKALTQLRDRWPLELSQVTAKNRSMALLLLKAAILDPRFKLKSASKDFSQYASASLQGEAVQHLATACSASSMPVAEEIIVEVLEPVPSTSTAGDHDYFCPPSTSTQSASSGIDELFRDADVDEEPSDTESIDTVEAELRQFMQEKRILRSSCPLEWWKQNASRFKTLSSMAKLYLAVRAASAASERVFSVAGLTVNKLRSSLSGEHVDMLVTMHCNADLM